MSEATLSGEHPGRKERTVNPETVSPLTRADRLRFLSAASAYTPDPPDRWPWNMSRTLIFLYATGIHPFALVHPVTSRLRVENGCVRWLRPKTGRTSSVPRDVLIPWAEEYIASLAKESPDPKFHKWTTQYAVTHPKYLDPVTGRLYRRTERRAFQQDVCSEVLSAAVQAACKEIGFPLVSARTIRHTYGVRIYETSGGNVNIAAKKLRTSKAVALRYLDNDADAEAEVDAKVRAGLVP
jgi:integrase